MNSPGKLWRLTLDPARMELVKTGSVRGVNNDQGISPDGKWFVMSAGNIYVLPSGGGQPRQLTTEIPGYFHGFSPERGFQSPTNYDNGSEYSPDSKWICINSNRSGGWDIWRIPADGAGLNDVKAEQITSDELEDWFPTSRLTGRALCLSRSRRAFRITRPIRMSCYG